MCTVSVIPLGTDALRLACNRDELRTRAIALPPTIQTFGERRAILPTDPDSGGTWIAVNDAGVVFTLLNAKPAGALVPSPRPGEKVRERGMSGVCGSADSEMFPNAPLPSPLPGAGRGSKGSAMPSRGEIVSRLAGHGSVSETMRALSAIRAKEYRPFRLVIFDSTSFADVLSNGYRLESQIRRWGRDPQLFTSSGLGDQLVQAPRRVLFDEMVTRADDRVRAQDAFHAHTWPDRPHLSVRMSRDDARTVSRTVIEVRPDAALLQYHDEVTQSDCDVSLPLVRSR